MTFAKVLKLCGYAAPEAERRLWGGKLAKVTSLTAQSDGRWFHARAPLDDGSAADLLAPQRVAGLLAQKSRLAGGAKFTLALDPPRWFVSAQLPLDDVEAEAAAKIGPLCDGFRKAAAVFASLRRPGRFRAAAPPRQAAAEGILDPARRALCESIGWPLVHRADAQLAIELDVPGGYGAAAVLPRGEKGLLLAVELPASQSPAEICCLAAGVLLLHASHNVRMARAVARSDGEAITFGWEAALEGVAGEFELRHALAALSVAWRISARPLEAIVQDESLARSFLTLRGWHVT